MENKEQNTTIKWVQPTSGTQSEQLDKLFSALSKAQGEIKNPKKDKKGHNYKYVSLDGVIECAKESLMNHGLSVIQRVLSDDNGYYIETLLCHSSGQWMKSKARLLLDKNNMQGLGSAITYMRRYSYSSILGISPDEDDDGVQASPGPVQTSSVISEKQVNLLHVKLNGNKELRDAVLQMSPNKTLEGFYKKDFDRLLKMIEAKQGETK